MIDAALGVTCVRRETLRAKLKEAFRGFSAAPLNIYVATDDEMEQREMMGVALAFRTQQVWIREEDIGDDAKLQAAIRMPMLAILGGFHHRESRR